MLLSFTVGNFRSFKESKTFSMKAASIQEHKDFVRENNNVKLLPVAAVYGANSSGKSNLLSALRTMKNVLLSSVKTNPTEKLKTDTFKLDEEYPQKPTLFDAVFSTNGTTYRYGFEYTETTITGEWLYTVNNDREKNLFIRNSEGIGISKDFPEGKDKEEATAENRLFLSLVAQLNGKTSLAVMKWFEDLRIISGVYDSSFKDYSFKYLFADNPQSQLAQTFVNSMDLGFTSLRKDESKEKEYDLSNTNNKNILDRVFEKYMLNWPALKIQTGHKVLRKDGSFTEAFFPNDEMESEGTKKIINMSGPIVDSIINGGIIVVDEFDAKLHPLLTKKIIDIFNSPETNPYNAQLIFATHDTNLLSNKIFRRDQIWFAEKNREDESTDIYPLSEIKEQNGDKIRKDRTYEKDYINGKYGAIPYLRG